MTCSDANSVLGSGKHSQTPTQKQPRQIKSKFLPTSHKRLDAMPPDDQHCKEAVFTVRKLYESPLLSFYEGPETQWD